MTKHKTTKGGLTVVAVCLIAAACLAIFGNSSSRLQEPAMQQPGNDDSLALKKAVMRDGLRGAAKLRGNYVEEFNPHWDWARFDVEGLTKGSAAVVEGRFTKKLDTRLGSEGMVIYTDYEFSVHELIKGDIKKEDTIVVSLPGGRVTFEDGTSAEQTTPKFEHPQIGRAYTLFLMQREYDQSKFLLTGGPQGMFDIEDNVGVKSHGLPDDLTAIETKGKSRDAFMKSVREHAKKWPQPGKCCG
ncbi:MAG TPA: hypothetical protein VF397_00380 [Pyrinomonadaceae bacterium]